MTKTNSDPIGNLAMSALINFFTHCFHRPVLTVLNILTFEFKICFGPPWRDSIALRQNMSNIEIRMFKSKIENTRSGPGISKFGFRIFSSVI